jgi:hypothetical protein
VDPFTLVVVGALIAMTLVFLAIGRWHPKSGAEVLDWKPTRSPEKEIELELEDVDQMIEAQNERRRRSGRPELTEEEIRGEVEAEEREREERAERFRDG